MSLDVNGGNNLLLLVSLGRPHNFTKRGSLGP